MATTVGRVKRNPWPVHSIEAKQWLRLQPLGFEMDWTVTGPGEAGWYGVIDPIGRTSIAGDCRGHVCWGQTKAQMLRACITEARSLTGYLEPCPFPEGECDHHDVE